MSLDIWQKKIQDKRKHTSLKQFLLEIPSWFPAIFSKNKGLISRFPETSRVQITSQKKFDEQRDTLLSYGREYIFEEDFFSQFQKLFLSIKLPQLTQFGNHENIEFTDNSGNSKNAYLSSTVLYDCENIFYSIWCIGSKNIYNSLHCIRNSDIVHFGKGIRESYKIFYSSFIQNCSDIWFSSNLTGCKDCLFCSDLENVSYAIHNTVFSKEEYFQQKEKILSQKEKFSSWSEEVSSQGINRNNQDCEGNFIRESENISNGLFVANAKNGRNIMFSGGNAEIEDFYDCFSTGGGGKSHYYGITQGGGGEHNYCSIGVLFCNSVYYSFYLDSCSFCFGCVGLQNKSYCIFNKQYTKEAWSIKVDEIFSQMEKDGILGDFFPGTINPFYFNDTIAGMMDIFSKEEAIESGFLWREEVLTVATPEGVSIIDIDSVSQYEGSQLGEWKIDKQICKKVIRDTEGNLFTYIPGEIEFYEKYGLPLPKNHWKNRILGHIKSINFFV